ACRYRLGHRREVLSLPGRVRADLPDDDAGALVDHVPLHPLHFVGRLLAADASVEDVEVASEVSQTENVFETLRVRDDVAFSSGRGRADRDDLDSADAGQPSGQRG